MKKRIYLAITILALCTGGTTAYLARAQQPKDTMQECPMHHQHNDGVNERGDRAMGFDHQKTTHHFRLTKDGGVIEVGVNDLKDTESLNQIRLHLKHIAHMFGEGDFSTPMFIHAQTPPGVPVMKRLKASISYSPEETERGAQVRISTKDEEALAAIHDFLRFQIQDHQTGDPLEVGKD